MRQLVSAVTVAFFASACLAQDFAWAPHAPIAAAKLRDAVGNAVIITSGGSFRNDWTSEMLIGNGPGIQIILKDGKRLDCRLNTGKAPIKILLTGSRGRSGMGWSETFTFPTLTIQYNLAVIDGENYARIETKLTPKGGDVDVEEVQMISLKGKGLRVVGKTPGSPVVSESFFMGVEHPMSVSAVSSDATAATCSIRRLVPIRNGTTVIYTAVVGVAPEGQMRRAFLNYVESERPRPYQPFLHYNSWYDIGYFTPYSAKDCIDRIEKFGQQLAKNRGVELSSFLFDDGWDDYRSVWEFHKGFPDGFLPVSAEAKKFGAAPGVWLSPWGGYGGPRKTRLEYGKAHGMEVDSQGYALSGPKYYKRFHDVTLDFVTRQGINHFKFDGTGSPDKYTPGSQFDSDFDAAISLIADLRKAKPGLFVNLTTGTWPSPFWLGIADSIWRGGSDHSFAGVGSYRQQWITYRDSDLYHGVVERGPLFPVNSLMLHGIIYAQHAQHLNDDPKNDFKDEVRDYFGGGTQLQEMYITPDLLTSRNWDDLAEAAKWSQANAETLKDTHWIGGDPAKLEVYGWASWSKNSSILVLRNPSDKQQAFSVDAEALLELPKGKTKAFEARSPFAEDRSRVFNFPVGKSLVVDLEPFQVLVLNLEPKS